jgi:hypothetical protein
MSECTKCNKNLATNDEKVLCGGTCNKQFHLVCTDIGRSLYQGIKINKNIVWYCDGCLNILDNLNAKINLIFNHLLSFDEKFCENFKKVEELKNDVGSIQVKSRVHGEQTYAEKLKLAKNEPVIVIKPKDTNKTGKETREDVRKQIDPSKVPVKEMRNVARGSVVLECKNADATEQVRQEVEEKLGKDYDISISELRNPEIKVIGLYDEPEENEIVAKIKRQNDFIESTADIQVLKIEASKRQTKTFSVALKVDPKTYSSVMEMGKLNIGWNRCRVVENIRILRCFKCAEYGHKIVECKNADCCNKCAGPHNTNDCTSNVTKCINCDRAKARFGLDIQTDHPVWSNNCLVYNRILTKRKKTINYYG